MKKNIDMNDLTLRDARLEDLPMIFSHMERIWDNELVAERKRTFDWLFINTPYMKGELSPIYIFTDEKKIYGVAFLVPVDIYLFGKDFRIVWGGTVSLEEFLRGREVGNLIANRIRDTDSWSTGYPIEATLPMYQSAVIEGHPLHVPGKFGTVVKPLRVDMLVPVAFLRPAANSVFRLFDRVSTAVKAGLSDSGYKFGKVSRFDDDFDEWFDSARKGYTDLVIMKTDSAYLNWRYLDAPTGDYSAFTVRKNGELKGYYVLDKYLSRGVPVYCIVDFLAARGDSETVGRILADAISIARSDSAFMLKIQECYNPEFSRIYRKFGFLSGRSTKYPLMMHVPPEFDAGNCLDQASYFFGRGFADPKII